MKDLQTNYRKLLNKPIQENSILLEAGQGWHANGNPFALLRILETDPAYRELKPYFSVRAESEKEIKQKFQKYGFHKAVCVIRESEQYYEILATAKYLITDNSFPSRFIKRKEQRFLNTWHGTPIKHLGRADIAHAQSLGNVQKNLLVSDYLLFPNQFTKDVFYRDYMIDGLYKGRSLVMDYPRNDALKCDSAFKEEILSRLNAEGKKLCAYMPTWRRTDGTEEHADRFLAYLKQLDGLLDEDTIILLNLHHLSQIPVDYSSFRHILPFPKDYEPYEVLSLCHTLITDYSSVMFDYALTGRKVVLFVYDREEYEQSNGMYRPLEELGFDLAVTAEDLAESLRTGDANITDTLREEYGIQNTGKTAEKLLALLTGDECGPGEDGTQNRKTVFYYAGDLLEKASQERFTKILSQTDFLKERTVLVFYNRMTEEITDFLAALPQDVFCLKIPSIELDTLPLKKDLFLYKNTGSIKAGLASVYEYEYRRLFYYINFQDLVCLEKKKTRIEGLFRYIKEKHRS